MGSADCNGFFLKNLASDVSLKCPISMRHCVLLIGIITNGNPYEWTHITIVNVKQEAKTDFIQPRLTKGSSFWSSF